MSIFASYNQTQLDIQPEVPVEVSPDALPLEEEEAGDNRVVEQAAVWPRLGGNSIGKSELGVKYIFMICEKSDS